MASIDTMAPWDALPWFDTPVQTDVVLTGATQLLVPFDVRRVVLCLFQLQSAGVTIGVTPALLNTTGHVMNPNQGPLIFTQAQHGPLCQMAWYANSSVANVTLSVVEVKLRDWPRPGGQGNGQVQAAAPPAVNRLRRFIQRTTGRPQPAPLGARDLVSPASPGGVLGSIRLRARS